AWGAADVEATEFVQNPFGHGWHVDRRALDEALRDRLHILGVRVRPEARLAGQVWTADQWRIGLSDRAGVTIQARALVDATASAASTHAAGYQRFPTPQQPTDCGCERCPPRPSVRLRLGSGR